MPQITPRAAMPLLLALAGGVRAAIGRRPGSGGAPAGQASPRPCRQTRSQCPGSKHGRPGDTARVARSAEEASARGRSCSEARPFADAQRKLSSACTPSIQEFVARHPEVPQNASFYLEQVYGVDGNWQPVNPRLIRSRARSPALPG